MGRRSRNRSVVFIFVSQPEIVRCGTKSPSQPIEVGPCLSTRSRVSIHLIAGIPQKGGKATSEKKQPTIKAATGFRNMKPDAVYSAANAIYTGLNGNTNIPAPPAPFDLATLLAANQALSAANLAALDGGRRVVA